MEGSTGLRSMIDAHVSGLRRLNESSVKPKKPTWWPVAMLYVPPVAIAALTGVFGWNLRPIADALLGGFALMAGVLIAVFTQLASWRDRLQDRAEDRWLSEAPARSAIDSASVHALVGVLGSAGSVLFAVLLQAKVPGLVVWGAALAAAAVWVLGLLFLIVRSIYVGFESTASNTVRRNDARIMSGTALREDAHHDSEEDHSHP